jgi:hypothetical protein
VKISDPLYLTPLVTGKRSDMPAIVNELVNHVHLIGTVTLKEREQKTLIKAHNIQGQQAQSYRAAENQPIANWP